ncbi:MULTISPECIES: cupin domain-containing protein [unclassified Arthrobacter]|uniref:cupin domain-containing protein n=1 Tax=unclassified Arthrobacter TaxID=235627 RepID=UPI00288300AB|nr:MULTISPECIES: cupin domain-containing protein [unclassified Arthrobacter]
MSSDISGTSETADDSITGVTLPRRVVTGERADGRSIISSDEVVTDWTHRPTGLSVTEIWRADALPVKANADASGQPGVIAAPAASGLAVRFAVFPPDHQIDAQGMADYEASMKDLYGDQGTERPGNEIAGMHRTETVDILTVVEGEIWSIMDEGEALLRKGDCMVQRGTRHAWRNRSDRPCTVVVVVLPASLSQTE